MTALEHAALRQHSRQVLARRAGAAAGAQALAAAANRTPETRTRAEYYEMPEIPDDEPLGPPDTRLEPGEQAGGAGPDVTVGEPAIDVRSRESSVAAREETVAVREEGAGLREEAAALRETTLALREEAVRAREEAGHARVELEQLTTQLREANEHLIVAAVRAQTMTEDAEQASHLKDEFLATVSHELRTPLNAVLGWARMLESKHLPPDRETEAIAAIERSALALAQMIDDLLDVSRIVQGALRLASQPVDLAAVAQAALDGVRPLAATKNVRLGFTRPPGIRNVTGDAGRLQQVIWNLLTNAIKFTPEGGRVDVSIESSNDHMEIMVVDTGRGISPDFLPHVFERFRQAGAGTTERHSGLGLGLAIVRQLVELHRGTVHAASQGLGCGAAFTIRLPSAAGETPAGQAAALGERRMASTAIPLPPLPRLDGLRLLVVDDSPDGRTLTSSVLTEAGASVKTVASVREALRMIDLERPDALVSGIGLAESDEDGYALIRQLRQSEADRGGFLPAIALTSYARAEDRARILAAGFQVHVPKPVEPVELAAAIATITHHLRRREPT